MRKESWLILTAGLTLLFFGPGNYWSATWLSKWFLIQAFFCLAFAIWASRRTSWLHFPLIFYALMHLLVLAAWPEHPYTNKMDAISVLAVQRNAFYGLLEVLSLLALFATLTRKHAPGVRALFVSIWAIGTVTTLLLPWLPVRFPRAPDNGLWFGNPSMGASLLACLLPWVWALCRSKLRYLVCIATFALTWLMIYTTRASVPWGVLGVVVAAFWLASVGFRRVYVFLPIGALAGGMILVGQHALGHDFWDENRRFEIWGMAWEWFWKQGNHFIGMGFSTSQVLLPIEQVITKHFYGDYFLWLHNDWLQLAIEGGAVGMACVFLSFFRLLKISYPKPAIFASLAGLATLGLFNYPLRYPLHSVCLALICGLAEVVAREDRASVRSSPARPARSSNR